MSDWRRVVFAAVMTLVGTGVVVIASKWVPLTGPTSHEPRWLLTFGVVSGGVIGALEIGITWLLWHLRGEPDGVFRGGWSGVVLSVVLNTYFGASVGAAFGGLLLVIESRFKRAVRFRPLIPAMLLIAILACILTYLLQFQSEWIFLAVHAVVFAACVIAAALFAIPRPLVDAAHGPGIRYDS
jgi:hypothetical protein